ncbi:MAG: tetratricopeptide repeat protein [Prevotella sp.]
MVLTNAQKAYELYQKGNMFRQKGDWQHAIECYNEALSYDPQSQALTARTMIMDILEYRCKDIYNP